MNVRQVYSVGWAGRVRVAEAADLSYAGAAGGRDRCAAAEYQSVWSQGGIGAGAGNERDEDVRAAAGGAGRARAYGSGSGRKDARRRISEPGAAGALDVGRGAESGRPTGVDDRTWC